MGKVRKTTLDTDTYSSIVGEISNQNEDTISAGEVAKTATSAITTNNTVPKYVQADNDVVKMLKALKGQIEDVITTMKNVQTNLEETNSDAASSAVRLDR